MDLRRRFIHALAGTGAFLIVVGLSVGGGVAVAVSDPSAQPPADAAKATASSSDGKSSDDKSSDSKSSDRKSSKDRKSKSGRGGGDSTERSNSADSTGDSGSDDSTATSATTTPRSAPTSTTTPTTRPTATTQPTATTATTTPPRPATTAPPTTASTAPATTETTSADTTGQYDGGSPYSAAEAPTDDSTSTTTGTVPVGRTAKAPASRSGAGLPPGIHPVGPGTNTPNSSNAPATNSAPVTPVVPLPAPVAPAESQRAVPTTISPAAAAGTSDPATATEPGSEVSGTETERGDTAARSSQELVKTGDTTRRLIIFGGVALLMGAVVVAFTGREGPVLAAAAALPVGPARRPRPRKELDGWEDGVPLAPAKRELARNRLGISVSSYYDDELEV